MANSFSDDRSLPPSLRAAQFDKKASGEPLAQGASEPSISGCYALSENDGRAFGFRIFFADGTISGIFYHDVVSPMKFDGSGEIIISLVTFRIRITGFNLRAVFDCFFDHRVSWIKEQDASFFPASDEPVIETVKIEEYGG